MTDLIPTVFFDATTIIKGGRPPGGPLIRRIIDLAKSKSIYVIATDLSIMEVAKKHASNDYQVIKEVGRSHFRTVVKTLFDVDLPNKSKQDLFRMLYERYVSEVTPMYEAMNSKVVSINDVAPLDVFTDYTIEAGFFSGEGKKDQFPDAFHFARLKQEANKKNPVIIISDDKDYVSPCKDEPNIILVKTIPELFQRLGLRLDEPKQDITKYFVNNSDLLVQLFDEEVNNWGLEVSDVEDAQIDETTVDAVDFTEVISFGLEANGDAVLVVGKAQLNTEVSFSHPDWEMAMYDSEEKRRIPFDDVTGSTVVRLDVDFSMTLLLGEHGEIYEIEEISFTNDNFYWVEIIDDEYHY